MATSATRFLQMCRTCMMQGQNMHSIYIDSYANADNTLKIDEMLAMVAPQLIFNTTDPLPKQLCAVCLNTLQIAFEFQQMCIASEKNLRSILCIEFSTAVPSITSTSMCEEPVLKEDLIKIEADDMDLQQVSKEQSVDVSTVRVNTMTETIIQEQDPLLTREIIKCEKCEMPEAIAEVEKELTDDLSALHSECGNINQIMGVVEIGKSDLQNRVKLNLSCPDCNLVFDHAHNLKLHSEVHSKTRPFQCELCKYRFPTADGLVAHGNMCENETESCRGLVNKVYKCAECPRRFEKDKSLAAHMKIHRKADCVTYGEYHQCDYCPKKFIKYTLLTQHARSHPENHKHKCTQCDKAFGLKWHLKDHMNRHNGLKPFVCDFCKKAFHERRNLSTHKRIHFSGERTNQYLCSQCGKAFNTAASLRQHQEIHSSERRYQCPECPSKFSHPSSLTKHMVTHTGLKPHVCDICGSRFSRSCSLVKHKLIHTGERPHKCEKCNMTFALIWKLHCHMRTHTGEKPYKCKFCDRAYSLSGDLNKHMRSHVGAKTYKCDECTEAFKYHAELREHRRQHYKQQQAALELITATNTEKKD